MEAAYKTMKTPKSTADTLFLSDTFLASSEPQYQATGLRYLADALLASPANVSIQQEKLFASKVLELRQYDTLAFVLTRTNLDDWQPEVRKALATELAELRNDEHARSMCGLHLDRLLTFAPLS